MSARPIDEEILRTRREWKKRFRERMRLWAQLIKNWPEDDTPTPRGEGDDE